MAKKKRKRRVYSTVEPEYIPTPEEIERLCALFRRLNPRPQVGVPRIDLEVEIVDSRLFFPRGQ